MPDSFKNILVPSDFRNKASVAVAQALELMNENGSTIHLLHVNKEKSIWNTIARKILKISQPQQDGGFNVISQLLERKGIIEEAYPNCKVYTYILAGRVQSEIEFAAKALQPELIIVGKKASSSRFPFFKSVCPNGLAKSTDCPVLAVSSNSIQNKIRIIVFPVGSFIPKRKVGLVVDFAKKYRAEIHMVTIPSKITSSDAFLETYRILRTGLTNPIHHHILKGNNLPKAVLHYAEYIQADMIVVNPCTETRISGFRGKHINDILRSASRLRILSIEPNLENKERAKAPY